jgi:hypothetical protein
MSKHQLTFDLISDLYVDNWKQSTDWSVEPTSMLAVVAGDISKDLDRTVHELGVISKYYRQVMFIDGDLEHADDFDCVQSNRAYLAKKLAKIQNITYMHEQVLIVNHAAFVAANLWWTPKNNDSYVHDDDWMHDMRMMTLHHEDLDYLRYTVHRMQDSPDVTDVVVVSHTVPSRELLLAPTAKNMATDASDYVESEDFKQKITAWCFGHCDRPVKVKVDRCVYVSNPKGKPETSSGLQYHPLRVVV